MRRKRRYCSYVEILVAISFPPHKKVKASYGGFIKGISPSYGPFQRGIQGPCILLQPQNPSELQPMNVGSHVLAEIATRRLITLSR